MYKKKMPQGVYSKILCSKYVKDANRINRNSFPAIDPKEHQLAVVDYFVNKSPHKEIGRAHV